jgi:hypothetical protein
MDTTHQALVVKASKSLLCIILCIILLSNMFAVFGIFVSRFGDVADLGMIPP